MLRGNDHSAAVAQAQARISMLTGQVAESAQQLDDSHDTKLQLEQQLQMGKVSLDESQKETGQALSDCLVLRCQLEEARGQLQQVRVENDCGSCSMHAGLHNFDLSQSSVNAWGCCNLNLNCL